MALVRRDPFREINSLQQDMDHLFDTFTPRFNGRSNSIASTPAAEMNETSDAVQLRLEVPGIEAKDLDIQVTAEAVSITGERKSETKTSDKGMTRSEFRYGKFQRVIPLSTKIQNNKVEAEYKDGILRLILPKVEDERNRVVKVNLG